LGKRADNEIGLPQVVIIRGIAPEEGCEAQTDFAIMSEAVVRRYRRCQEEKESIAGLS